MENQYGAVNIAEQEQDEICLSLVVAADENGVIGKDNKLPWHLPNDLKYFKNLTWAMPILMGRKTFESIGKALPGRKSIVITRDKAWSHPGVSVVHSVDEAVAMAQADGVKEIFIIGGAEIFASSLQQAGRIYLTRIHHRFNGDVYFASPDEKKWRLTREIFCAKDEKNLYDHSFQVWDVKRRM
ncbi:MAG TPA: dihydrofolate reductase [Flavisolibacter sp.]|nr:dihydrofolate reductase [Flavisolibacter sp.]